MKNNKGQGLIEYMILLALISVSAIAVVSLTGKNIKTQYANIANAIGGKGEKIQVDQVDADTYQARGMDDFMDSSAKRK